MKEPIDDKKEPKASRGIAIQAGEILFWKGFVAMSVMGGKRTLRFLYAGAAQQEVADRALLES